MILLWSTKESEYRIGARESKTAGKGCMIEDGNLNSANMKKMKEEEEKTEGRVKETGVSM